MLKRENQMRHWAMVTMLAILAMLVTILHSIAADIDVAIETHEKALDFSSPTLPVRLFPLQSVEKSYSLCVLVPHMKDEYWISVQSGFKERAKALKLDFSWHEAGGYLELDRQIKQINACVAQGHDAIILGAVSANDPALLKAVEEASRSTPVIAMVNELQSSHLTAKVAVSWYEMGRMLGQKVVADLPDSIGEPHRVTLVSGPSESGWAPILEEGLREGLKSDRIRFGSSLQSDSDYHNQFVQVEKAVADCQPNHIIIGSAPAAEAAMSLVRLIDCPSKPKIYASYYSLAVKRGLRSQKIEAAIVDFAVLQGWLAVEQSARILEGKLRYRQLGPKIDIATPTHIPADHWAVISR